MDGRHVVVFVSHFSHFAFCSCKQQSVISKELDVKWVGRSGREDMNYPRATLPIKHSLLVSSSHTELVITCRCGCSCPPPFVFLLPLLVLLFFHRLMPPFVSLYPHDDRGLLKIETIHPDYSVLITELAMRWGCRGPWKWQGVGGRRAGRKSGTVNVNCVLISVVCHSEAQAASVYQARIVSCPEIFTNAHLWPHRTYLEY